MQKRSKSQQLPLCSDIAQITIEHADSVPLKKTQDFSFVRTADSVPVLNDEHMLTNMLDRGVISVVFGEAGCRKTHFEMYAASIVSMGGTWFNGQQQEKAHVIIINLEDTEETIIKRLRANGADMAYCHIVREIPVNNPGSSQQVGKARFELPRDIELLDNMITHFGAQLVILDSARQVFANYQHDITCKKIMGPLAQMAENNHCSVLLINHRNGRTTRVSDDSVSAHNLLDSMAGSKLISSMARVVLYFYKDQNNHDFTVIRGAKSGIGRDDFKPVRYTLHETALRSVHVVFPGDEEHDNMQLTNQASLSEQLEARERGNIIAYLVEHEVNQTEVIQHFKGLINQLKVRLYIQEYIKQGQIKRGQDGVLRLDFAILQELRDLGYTPAMRRLGPPTAP